ncbi:hypothetical protein [uncultured Algibacter sp.]|uniref:hypothetical protein n=1 Tax=uncultured Algibacter sp. TaxID=298659 RepID=UPI003216E017
MRKLFFVIISLSLFLNYSCDDGDIITAELDFEDTLSACEGVSSLIFYKTKNDPSESLSLRINGGSIATILEVGDDNTREETITINTTNPFNYRTYSNTTLPSNLFCVDIQNPDVIITQNVTSESGEALIRTVLTEDDDDGVPMEFENPGEPDENGRYPNAQDTDGDGIPDYLDADDDGDNVLTRDEGVLNADGVFILEQALNTDKDEPDGDDIPDYLDADDDGDGVKTRDEENEFQNQNPRDDETGTDSDGNPIPDYLNPNIKDDNHPATQFRENIHVISRNFAVTITILNIDLVTISQDELFFGVLDQGEIPNGVKSRTENPDFI